MECKGIREKLSSYLEGMVSPEEKRLIEQHLPSCQECSTAVVDLKKTRELVQTLEEVEPPPWFTQKVMARVRAEEEARKSLLQKLFDPLRVKVPIQALATVFIVVIAIYVFKAGEPEMKKSVQAPSVTGQVTLSDEASKQPAEPRTESPASAGKVGPKESLKRSDRRDLARTEEERGKGALKEEKPEAKEIKENLLSSEVSKPVPAEPPSPPVLAKKKGSVEGGSEETARAMEPSKEQAYSKEPSAPAG